ncbi:unnamed protein product [Nesidiocoris tenuis]|uniref:Uncharacterized protein n=1 Tax=Nesidiocoris tenuis TaxID=355587 RepID=A0A6H5HAD7_9HEMI|nr:unnamed protein product [Nesidiocoris tenuis]
MEVLCVIYAPLVFSKWKIKTRPEVEAEVLRVAYEPPAAISVPAERNTWELRHCKAARSVPGGRCRAGEPSERSPRRLHVTNLVCRVVVLSIGLVRRCASSSACDYSDERGSLGRRPLLPLRSAGSSLFQSATLQPTERPHLSNRIARFNYLKSR